jgi:DNA-directed RNA polymerase specialized sigma24 family protein
MACDCMALAQRRHTTFEVIAMNRSDNGKSLLELMGSQSDEAAWTTITKRYRRLLIVWATRCPAAATSGESAEDIADQAMTRAWLALSSKTFAVFPNLAAFLSYLRMCVTHVAIDAARSRATQARIVRWLTEHETKDLEQTMLKELERTELWPLLSELVKTEQERVVLVERFVLDIPPRIIHARHPALFADKVAVYSAVRNVCCRLQRHRGLQLLWDEYIAA